MDGGGQNDAAPRSDGVAGVARIGVLGPVRVELRGIEHPVTSRRQQAVLICLALHAGEPVAAERLLDDVWGDDPPETGVKAVAYQVSKLRSLFEPDRTDEGALISTTPAGYVLHLARSEVDLHRFDQLVDHAREILSRDPAAAEESIAQALRLWRGRPFTGLVSGGFIDAEARRLESRHLLARRTLTEARIARGRHADVVAELEAMVVEHPLEETLVHLLMTALHRSGRTAEALRAYAGLRQRLASELGIEPSSQLRKLEQQLLTDGEEGSMTTSGSSGANTAARGNLPAPLSSFVGRDDEIRNVSELLSKNRLVSLVSFGGAGKTRLAIEIATNLVGRFADGVWFVDLVPISDPSLVADTIIASIGFSPSIDEYPDEYLISQLATSEALIIVDNCEHVVDAVRGLVGRLVLAAPGVRVLVTSRLSLGIPGELIWPVQPLAIVSAARDLFIERARLVRAGFEVDDTNRVDVERICERLDGIPLAIELAAARLRTLTVAQIAELLDDRFRLLTSVDRSTDDRQRSVLTTMTWSSDLLDDEARDLLLRLSVFTDGFTLDAATAISADDASTLDVLDHLSGLIAAGLIWFDDSGEAARYRMLETVREFATGRLDESTRDALALEHARYFRSIAARVAELWYDEHHSANRLASQELGNLRAAITWAYATDQPRLGMSIATDLWTYFWRRGMNRENVRWGRCALELLDDDRDDIVLTAANTVIDACNVSDNATMAFAAARLERGLESVRDPLIKSRALAALASSVADVDPHRADEHFEAAWNAAPVRPSSIAILNGMTEMTLLTGTLDDGETVLARLAEILDIDSSRPPMAGKIQAAVAAATGQWEEVLRVTQSSANLGEVFAVTGELRVLECEALGALGRPDDAAAALPPLDPNDYPDWVRTVHLVLAPIDLQRGLTLEALARLEIVVDNISRDGRRLALEMHTASLLAIAANDLAQYETAAVLFGFAAAERDRLRIALRPSVRPLDERAIETCRAALGPERFDERARVGAATDWKDLPSVERRHPTIAP